MNRVLLFLVVILGFASEVRSDGELEDIRRRAVGATNAAVQAIPRAVGFGRYEFTRNRVVDGRLENRKPHEGEICIAYSGDRSWIKFEKSPDREYDAAICVWDGDSAFVSEFSVGMRPHGAEGHYHGHEYSVRYDYGILPHAVPRSFTYLGIENSPLEDDGWVPRLTEAGELPVVQFEKQGHVEKFFIDPRKGYHIVGVERTAADGSPMFAAKKEWAKTSDGLWYVREYCEEDFPRGAVKEYTRWKFTLESFRANVNVPNELFSADALGLPAGTRIFDRRFSPTKTRHARRPRTDIAALEKVVGKFPRVGGSLLIRSESSVQPDDH